MSAITPDPNYSLAPSGNLRRRMLVSRTFVGATIAAAGLAVAVLFILVYYAGYHGASQLSLSFLTSTAPGDRTAVPAAASGRRWPAPPRWC